MATVEVAGLPANCPTSASESSAWDPPPHPTRLDEIVGSLTALTSTRFDRIAKDLENNPSAQLYVILSPSINERMKARHVAVAQFISSRHLTKRTTFVESWYGIDRTSFWIVPAGAPAPQMHDDFGEMIVEPAPILLAEIFGARQPVSKNQVSFLNDALRANPSASGCVLLSYRSEVQSAIVSARRFEISSLLAKAGVKANRVSFNRLDTETGGNVKMYFLPMPTECPGEPLP